MTEVDPNTIIANALTDMIKSSFNAVSEGATKKIRDAWSRIFEDFDPFMREVYKRNNYVRILSQKEKDIPLYSVYVESSFRCGNDTIGDEELIHNIREGSNVVINGNGGAGKTFFMRHLWLTLFKSKTDQVPIFIELRRLNELSRIDLLSFVRRTISRKRELDESLFSVFCEDGRFCFILDGYDEVIHSQRDALQAQILDLASSYPSCRFVISSRYERRFAGWQSFVLYESSPFSLTQVQKLVSRVPFDDTSRALFRRQLTPEFYSEHRSFLCNPLLAIMMMMTFKENMDIPKRMNIFYDQAFTTLYLWHDATKAFSRDKCLAIDDFQRSFAVFCLLSYYKEQFQFTKTEIIAFIAQSNTICGIKENPESILLDYEESVNLLKQDGMEYVFIHRSFQEYFTALALTRIMHHKFSEIVPHIAARSNDSVIAMTYEMNKTLVTEHYISTAYEQLQENCKLNEDKNYQYMSSLGVALKCSVHNEDPVSKTPQLGVSFTILKEFEQYFNHVQKIRGIKPALGDVAAEMLIIDGMFDGLASAVMHARKPYPEHVHVYFEDGDLVVNVGGTTRPSDEHTQKASKIKSHLLSSKILDKMETAVAAATNSIFDWSQKEVSAASNRERSLTDILGI